MLRRTDIRWTRRDVVVAGGGAGIVALVLGCRPIAAATPAASVIDKVLAGRRAELSARVRLDVPETVEYGNTVPLGIAVESPMTEADHVRTVHVFADGNPFPEVASFHFVAANGVARAATRIRLEKGRQRVWAVAELSGGAVLLAGQEVEASISGCGGDSRPAPRTVMPTPKPRIKLPERAPHGAVIEIHSFIPHDMETGLRTDAAGNPIPRRIIHRMACSLAGQPLFTADLSPAIAANAYLGFAVKACRSGMVEFAWHEDGGAVYRTEQRLEVD